MNNQEQKRAALYMRVSTREQAHKGTSIESQELELKKYTHQHDILIHDVYIDDGYSGSNINRPRFQDMLNDANNELFDIILIWKYDRLNRSLRDQENLIYDLSNLNISVNSITEDKSILLRQILGAVGEDELRKTLERSSTVKLMRAEQGYHLGRAPYGYDFDPDTHELVQNEDSDRVRKLFRVRDSGDLNVSHFANDNGLTRQGVYGILKNPLYKGYVRYQGKLIKGKHEGIIED